MSRKITDEELIENLKELCKKLGRTPNKEDFKFGKYSQNAYRRAFGNLTNSFISAGLQPNQKRLLSDQEILDDIKRIHDELGRTPEAKEFNELSNTVSSKTVINKFGTWNNALNTIKLPLNKIQKVSKEEVKQSLQNWYDKNNQDARCLEYWTLRKARGRDEFPYSTNTILRKSDQPSWESAMREYGFEDYETVNQFVKRGFFQGYDGNTYLSSIEKQVGDYLYILKNQEKIINYHYEFPVCADRGWTCDFKLELSNNVELWLEIDGMLGNRSVPYGSGKNDKIEYYRTNGINYYIITYRDRNICSKISSLV